MTEIRDNEPIDVIAGDAEATAWRRAARRHQANVRVANGWPVGVHVRKETRRPVGSRIDATFAEAHGCNFVTPAASAAVTHRLANPQKHQTLDRTRLWSDMLSSMPMCFNLFGPMWADRGLAAQAAHRWFPDLVDPADDVRVEFEWSPGRRDAKWLGDRTAFDAVFLVDGERGRRLVGIETKYHEYPVRPATGTEANPRGREVTDMAELFADAASIDVVRTTKLEQVWRDHLLALACSQADGGWTQTRYVLAAPQANPVWARLIEEYRSLLRAEASTTVTHRTIDELVASAAGLLPHADAFVSRYLDVEM